MTVILHTYTDQRLDEQQETLEQIEQLKQIYGDMVISHKCNNTDDYWSLLLRYWRKQDIITIEQDVVAYPLYVTEMLQCVRHVCTYPYRLRAGQLSVWEMEEYELRHGEFREYIPDFYEVVAPDFSNGTSLGFTKIDLSAQRLVPLWEYPVDKYNWWYLDSFISWYLNRHGQRIHVHRPEVKHNRRNELTINIGDQSFLLSEQHTGKQIALAFYGRPRSQLGLFVFNTYVCAFSQVYAW